MIRGTLERMLEQSPVTLPASDRESIGAFLASARKGGRLTQRDVESASRMPQGRISRIERGAAKPGLDELVHLADVLGIDVEIVFTEREH